MIYIEREIWCPSVTAEFFEKKLRMKNFYNHFLSCLKKRGNVTDNVRRDAVYFRHQHRRIWWMMHVRHIPSVLERENLLNTFSIPSRVLPDLHRGSISPLLIRFIFVLVSSWQQRNCILNLSSESLDGRQRNNNNRIENKRRRAHRYFWTTTTLKKKRFTKI